jgi:hypothetical protein
MCLYGHDIDQSVTPGMAGLGWVVSKTRRDNPGMFIAPFFRMIPLPCSVRRGILLGNLKAASVVSPLLT